MTRVDQRPRDNLWTWLHAALVGLFRISQTHHIRIRGLNRIIKLAEEKLPEFPARTSYCGKPFYFPSKSRIGQHVARGGVWDLGLADLLAKVVGSPKLVVEVGSNIGASILPIKSRFPDTALVLVEPAARYRAYLRANVSGHASTTFVVDRLLSDRRGETVKLRTNSTTGSAANFGYGADLTTIDAVETSTVDDLLDELHRTSTAIDGLRVDFLKVDTDGFEEKVFKGARRTISVDKPLIFTEFAPTLLSNVEDPRTFVEYLIGDINCAILFAFSPTGEFRGRARTYDELVGHMQQNFYLDIITAPVESPWFKTLESLHPQIND